jgi:hypothetical protein
LNESNALTEKEDSSRKREESRVQKDNEKIVELERKFDMIVEEYNAMMALQTSWKA